MNAYNASISRGKDSIQHHTTVYNVLLCIISIYSMYTSPRRLCAKDASSSKAQKDRAKKVALIAEGGLDVLLVIFLLFFVEPWNFIHTICGLQPSYFFIFFYISFDIFWYVIYIFLYFFWCLKQIWICRIAGSADYVNTLESNVNERSVIPFF